MSDAITVTDVSRRFDIYERPGDVLKELLFRRPRHDVFWALRHITFSLREGQRLGIIGPNGSGKSTLLKIITGNLPPSLGSVTVNGRLSALLSLNSVFNPEESGIENTRLNLLMNGCPRAKINDYVEEIADFAELGPFLYNPVKTYSTGMNARLSFAIATAIQPEILIVDEVLSVGDAYFVGKALRRMVDICNKGKALLFVSHDVSAVQRLCDSVLWLDQGEVREYGPVSAVLARYEADSRAREDQATRPSNAARAALAYGAALAEECTEPTLHRFRLVRVDGKPLSDSHFVRRLALQHGEDPELVIDVGHDDLYSPEKGYGIDVVGSEWGRSYERHGHACRLVFAQRGRRKGAQFLLRAETQEAADIVVVYEISSLTGQEELGLEHLDMARAEWVGMESCERVALPDGWIRQTFRGRILLLDAEAFQRQFAQLQVQQRPQVEIEQVGLWADGGVTHTLREREPFQIRIGIRAHRLTPSVDVGLKVVRSDGTYVFWQSSGLAEQAIQDLTGPLIVCFQFDQNYFAAGEYYLTAYCANEWDPDRNYPYSEVFDRRVNAVAFTVRREFAALDFGQINQRIAVSVERPA